MWSQLGKNMSVSCREVQHAGWRAVYVTVLPEQAIKSRTAVKTLFSQLYNLLQEKGITILLEKIYGLSSLREEVALIRNHEISLLSGDKDAIPFTYIGCIPCIGGKLGGVQVIGVIPAKKGFRTESIFLDGEPVGRTFEGDSFKEIYLSAISGLPKSSKGKKVSPAKQAEHLIQQLRIIFGRQAITIRHVVRTWIYFPRILSWYKTFNKIRAACFKQFGLISGDKTYLPASTGIQGRGRPKEDIFVDLVAFLPKKKRAASITTIRSKRQNEARRYGATFSRGVEIKINQTSVLHISGTASIDPKGKTIYQDDEQGQITETLINLGALLETKGCSLTDMMLTAAYCKNRRTYQTFRDIIKYLGLSSIPFVPVYADICRDDLLFEIDAVAAKQS